MPIELTKDAREQAVNSIQSFSASNMDEKMGNIAAGALLDFFLEEIAPCVYNKAVADLQDRMHSRVLELDSELMKEEFPYWRKRARVD